MPADGVIASGAVGFCTAGTTRTAGVAGGARLDLHTWGGDGFVGTDLPWDHLEHQRCLDDYAEMGIPAGSYWFTLQAAGLDDIHLMTVDEVERYGLLTAP